MLTRSYVIVCREIVLHYQQDQTCTDDAYAHSHIRTCTHARTLTHTDSVSCQQAGWKSKWTRTLDRFEYWGDFWRPLCVFTIWFGFLHLQVSHRSVCKMWLFTSCIQTGLFLVPNGFVSVYEALVHSKHDIVLIMSQGNAPSK